MSNLLMNLLLIVNIIVVSLLALTLIISFRKTKDDDMSTDEFAGLLSILSAQIQTELDAYERDIFEKKGAITNNNFDNFYLDLTNRIIANIPDTMIDRMKLYYTEEAVYKFIARSVKEYLTTKIVG